MKSIKIVALAVLGMSQTANAYDITDAIDASLKNNTQLKESKVNFKSATLNRFAAASEFLPSVTIQSTSSSTASKGDVLKVGTPVNHQLQIAQQIFSGGKGIYDLKSTKYSTDAAAVQYQNNIDAIIVQTVQAYEYVIAAREAYLVAQQKVDSLRKIVNQSELKLSVGTITKTNMLEARARLAAAISEKEAAYSNMKDTEENFRYITGDTAPPKMDEIDIKNLILPNNLELFLEEVERNNQSIVAADKNLTARRFATRSAKTSLLPTVTASAAVNKQKSWQQPLFSAPKLQDFDSETYQLSVSIPIFQSGQEYVRIKKAQLEEDAAEVSKDDTVMKTCKDAAAAWNKYNQTRISVQSDKDSVEFYREFARGADEEFQIGTKTLTDLLQAQVQYEDSKIKLIQDRALMVVSALNMRFLMGDLNKVNFSKLVVKEKVDGNNKKTVAGGDDVSGKALKKISEASSANKLKKQKST